jgi:hypothetical protein
VRVSIADATEVYKLEGESTKEGLFSQKTALTFFVSVERTDGSGGWFKTLYGKDFVLLKESLGSFSSKVDKIPFPSRNGTSGAGTSPTKARESYANG